MIATDIITAVQNLTTKYVVTCAAHPSNNRFFVVTLTDPTTRKGMQRNIDRLAMPEAVMTEIKQMIAQAQAKQL